MAQRSRVEKKEDIYELIKEEERVDKIRFYTRMTLSTSLIILLLVTYCLNYITIGTAEYYICLFTLVINLLIILLVSITFKRVRKQTSHDRKK